MPSAPIYNVVPEMPQSDSADYLKKKQGLTSILTIYGRKPVLEALQNHALQISRLHLADSNKRGGTLDTVLELASAQNIETLYHSRQALARISKNGKQDQGVALDIKLKGFIDYRDYLERSSATLQGNFIALDNITNPQNLGMIIRTVSASPITALILPRKGCAKLDALVIKASAGAIFKANILWCDTLAQALNDFAQTGAAIVALSSQAQSSLWDYHRRANNIFVLGNETLGLSPGVENACQQRVRIPMENAVESLNVAVTAGIIAFGFHNIPNH